MTSLRLASAAVGFSALLLLSACGTNPGTTTPAPGATTAAPTTASEPTGSSPSGAASTPASSGSATSGSGSGAAQGSIITPTPSVVRSAADAAQAPTPELRAFIESRINELTQGCTLDPKPELHLTQMRVDDLITGEARDCGGGGGAFLWAKIDDTWKVAAVAQAPPACSELRSAGITTTIPDGFVGHECMTNAGQLVTFDPNGS